MEAALRQLESMAANHPQLKTALDQIQRGPDGNVTIG
jgi:hypothetical protein